MQFYLHFPICRQHQAVNKLLDADLAAVFPLSPDVIHLGADLFKWEESAGIGREGFIHKILNPATIQIPKHLA